MAEFVPKQLSSIYRNYMSCKAPNIYFLAFYRKSLSTSAIEHQYINPNVSTQCCIDKSNSAGLKVHASSQTCSSFSVHSQMMIVISINSPKREAPLPFTFTLHLLLHSPFITISCRFPPPHCILHLSTSLHFQSLP